MLNLSKSVQMKIQTEGEYIFIFGQAIALRLSISDQTEHTQQPISATFMIELFLFFYIRFVSSVRFFTVQRQMDID